MNGIGTLATAVLRLSISSTELTAGLASAEADTRARVAQIGKVLDGVRNVAAIAFTAGVAALGSFASAAKQAEEQTARFRSTFELMGGAIAAQIPAAEKWADQMRAISDFDQEDLLEQLGKTVQVTGNVADAMLAMEAAADLARLKNLDLAQAQQLVIMGYNGQDRGLKKLIGSLGEGVKGHSALVEIQKRVAGGAEATANTVSRAEERMKLAWEDAKEQLGKDLQPVLIELYGWLGDIAKRLEGVNGQTVMWATAISGLVLVGAQAVKWGYEMRAAIAAVQAATAGANIAGGGMLGWIRAMPGAIGVAITALGALALAMKKVEDLNNSVTNQTDDMSRELNPNINNRIMPVGVKDGQVQYKTGEELARTGLGLMDYLGTGLPQALMLSADRYASFQRTRNFMLEQQEREDERAANRPRGNQYMMPPTGGDRGYAKNQAGDVRPQFYFGR